MIEVNKLFKFLNKNKIKFFSGVPDSILKNTKKNLEKKNKNEHIITANEGSAIASGIGYYLSTGKLPCIYMQNSGLGNAINPLISIAHKKVYSIPIFLLIGWRGAPNIKDEPQHTLKGAITLKLLKLLNIKYCILNQKKDFLKIKKLINYSKKNKVPVACLIKKNILTENEGNKYTKFFKSNIQRHDFIKTLLKNIKPSTKIISTTGYTSRELYQLRKKYNLKNGSDFYMVGGMGHSSMVALGVSIHSKKQVICLDGDGSMIMHMGSLANIGNLANENYKHILLNNYSHESVGGQKTFSEKIKFNKIAKGSGYKKYYFLNNKQKMIKIIKKFLTSKGPSFLEVAIRCGSIDGLTRPKNLINIKKNFMNK
jgi:phosphonopyruvate decarboxylase